MPTTFPLRSTSAPPLFPGLIEASVCSKSCSTVPSGPLIWRSFALSTPTVTVFSKPKGFPIAITQEPIGSSAALPSVAAGSSPPGTLSTAISDRGSIPTTCASKCCPSARDTPTWAAPFTTCAFVRMWPRSPSMMMPLPWPFLGNGSVGIPMMFRRMRSIGSRTTGW